MQTNPIEVLRTSLEQLVDGAAFMFDVGQTRSLVRHAQKALDITTLPVVNERPVGIFRYDVHSATFIPADEKEAKDKQGNLKEGYEYLFKHPVVANKRH
jgi:hypothetical protein